MYVIFLKVTSHTQEIGKVCLWAYLVKNNELQQFVKFMISSASHMHIGDLSRTVNVSVSGRCIQMVQIIFFILEWYLNIIPINTSVSSGWYKQMLQSIFSNAIQRYLILSQSVCQRLVKYKYLLILFQ